MYIGYLRGHNIDININKLFNYYIKINKPIVDKTTSIAFWDIRHR